MAWIKICGIKDSHAASAAMKADAIGFIFAPGGKRTIAPEKAAEISKLIKKKNAIVGVFVNQTSDEINSISLQVGLDFVQLHGEEPPEFLAAIDLPVIKAIGVGSPADLTECGNWSQAWALLLDTKVEGSSGGSGQTFNWRLLPSDLSTLHERVIVAGGLDIDNSKELIDSVAPFGVDMSSKLETDGIKDSEKIRRYLDRYSRKP